ncbi:MAG: hypothetical protein RIC19_20415 [Phaeodactylibacter sp.]|uniref:hypothetical protein n=1 Tax=Phaeodactylibacter sp. TaxID=1940289 RepID=UPI0032EED8C5
MAHNIYGVITSFTYEGDLPNVVLAEGYHLIPLESTEEAGSSEKPVAPYGALLKGTTAVIRELSFLGKCAYIETAYFGGIGTQIAETWLEGKRIEGPLISYDGVEPKIKFGHVAVVDGAINQALRHLGVQSSEEADEFDVVGLGRYRSNRKIFAESGH